EGDLEAGPGGGDAGVEDEGGAPEAEAEDGFDAGAVEPSGGAGVPGHAAAAHMRGDGVDVGGDDVGLDLVALDVGASARVVDGVEQRKEGGGLVALAEGGEGDDGPGGGVGVLAAVFPDAGRVALDVAGVERGALEGRGEEEGKAVGGADEVLLHGGHGALRARRVGGAGDDGPGLRDGVDAAFVALGGAERGPVVEVAAPVPVAVPAVAL